MCLSVLVRELGLIACTTSWVAPLWQAQTAHLYVAVLSIGYVLPAVMLRPVNRPLFMGCGLL